MYITYWSPRLTHSHLLRGENAPKCERCRCNITINHMLLECPQFNVFRQNLFREHNSLTAVLKNISVENIIIFLKRIKKRNLINS